MSILTNQAKVVQEIHKTQAYITKTLLKNSL